MHNIRQTEMKVHMKIRVQFAMVYISSSENLSCHYLTYAMSLYIGHRVFVCVYAACR